MSMPQATAHVMTERFARAAQRAMAAGGPQISDRQLRCVSELSAAWLALEWSNSSGIYQVSAGSDQANAAIEIFLHILEAAQHVLSVKAAPRDYRQEFTVNYRLLFGTGIQQRDYRFDVFESSTDCGGREIFVNGESYCCTPETIGHAQEFQSELRRLGQKLDQCISGKAAGLWRPLAGSGPSAKALDELKDVMLKLDFAYARMEKSYINYLIKVEIQAKQLLVEAAVQVQRFKRKYSQSSYKQKGKSNIVGEAKFAQMHRELACSISQYISNLNVVVNVERKGRGDLDFAILESACYSVLKYRDIKAKRGVQQAALFEPMYHLGRDVLDTFHSLVDYLSRASTCLERLDAQLSRNQGLRNRLVSWEESWEIGDKYMRNEAVMHALCSFVHEARSAQHWLQSFEGMCTACDPQLFLVLPRLLWASFLQQPRVYRSLLQSFLPHHFEASADGAPMPKPAIESFRERFLSVTSQTGPEPEEPTRTETEAYFRLSEETACEPGQIYPPDVVEVLSRIILGDLPEARGHDGDDELRLEREFMRVLEAFSMELQRTCPDDWNRFSAIVLQSLGVVERESRRQNCNEHFVV